MPKVDLVYCSCPSRLTVKKDEIMKFVHSLRKAPVHPFNAFPFEYFEGSWVGREATVEARYRLIDICDEFWLFGISESTIMELEYFISQTTNPLRPFVDIVVGFDPEVLLVDTPLVRKYRELSWYCYSFSNDV